MKRALSASLIALLLVACAETDTSGLSEKDQASIETASKLWQATHAAKDWDQLLSFYTVDAIFIPPEGPVIEGRDNIHAWFVANETDALVELNNIEIEGTGDLAFVRGTSRLTMTSDAGLHMVINCHYLDIRVRDANDVWRISRDMVRCQPPE